MKLKKGIPVIDQGDRLGFWGGKFGGNFVPETLKKPIEDLEIQFNKLKNDKNFIKERDVYFKNWIGRSYSYHGRESRFNYVGSLSFFRRKTGTEAYYWYIGFIIWRFDNYTTWHRNLHRLFNFPINGRFLLLYLQSYHALCRQ